MRGATIGLLLLFTLTGCPRTNDPWQPSESGTVILTVTFVERKAEVSSRDIPTTAEQLKVTVTGPDQDPVSQTKQLVPNASGMFDPVQFVIDVPAGRGKTITAEAMKADGFVVGKGSATGDLAAGSTVQVSIELNVTGVLVIVIS